MKKCTSLRLQTDSGILGSHKAFSKFLEKTVEDLLLHPAKPNMVAQQTLLEEVETVFTEKDNKMFLIPPSKDDVWKAASESNLNAAPGTDGIPSLFYKEC